MINDTLFLRILIKMKLKYIKTEPGWELTLTWQFRPSWATDFFRVRESSSASDFRFCGRKREPGDITLSNRFPNNNPIVYRRYLMILIGATSRACFWMTEMDSFIKFLGSALLCKHIWFLAPPILVNGWSVTLPLSRESKIPPPVAPMSRRGLFFVFRN